MVEILTSETFDEKIATGTVIIDFFADWCGPCRRLAPIFQELSEEMTEVGFFKVNVDEQGDIAQRFGVQSLPTLMVFKDSKQVERIAGLMPKDTLKSVIEKHK